MYFETEGRQLICEERLECQEVEGRWPENPESTAENNYELVSLGQVGEAELGRLNLGTSRDNLWLEIGQQGVVFRAV
jgi:hypothetical protein